MIKTRQNKSNAEINIFPADFAPVNPPVEPMPDLGLVAEPQVSMGADLQYDIEQLSVVWMTVVGLTPEEIEECLGKPDGYVTTLRAKPSFRVILKRCLEMKAQSVVESAESPEELFNSQILDSVAALIQIRDNPFASDTARLKAAVQFLDRAPKAPKVRREVEQTQTIITLPVSALQNMQQALLEEGSPQDLETIELLEGADFTVESGGGNDGQVAVERIE